MPRRNAPALRQLAEQIGVVADLAGLGPHHLEDFRGRVRTAAEQFVLVGWRSIAISPPFRARRDTREVVDEPSVFTSISFIDMSRLTVMR